MAVHPLTPGCYPYPYVPSRLLMAPSTNANLLQKVANLLWKTAYPPEKLLRQRHKLKNMAKTHLAASYLRCSKLSIKICLGVRLIVNLIFFWNSTPKIKWSLVLESFQQLKLHFKVHVGLSGKQVSAVDLENHKYRGYTRVRVALMFLWAHQLFKKWFRFVDRHVLSPKVLWNT